MPKHRLLGPLVAALILVPAAPALAAPVTVDLRVEGPTRTLAEQKVTVDVRKFKFSNSTQEYLCDGTGSSGTAIMPSPTRGAALAQAAERTPFELLGGFGQYGASFTKINGEGVDYDPATMRFLAEYKNGQFASVGACGDTIANGDDVLFAYGDGSEPVLKLTGSATAKPGEAVTLKAVNAASSAPVAGATVGTQTTGADGTATFTAPASRGTISAFKAIKPGAIRSNRVDVCVTDGADGFCGTTAPTPPPNPGTPPNPTSPPVPSAPPVPGTPPLPTPPPGTPPLVVAPVRVAAFAQIGSIKEQKRFAKGAGPRTLRGRVDVDAAGVRDVRLRLSRTSGKRCARYDGVRERFVATKRCGITRARTFSVGSAAGFSYLLPAALPRGRYVLDVIVVDRAGNQTKRYLRGRNRVVFFVG